jgi:UDP-N-acetylmuramyl pentapeptide phosphotransferase/UDP-N-acetylglucosamine-1-phosphate transferase
LILAIGLVDDFYKTRKKEFPVFPRLIVHIGVASLVFWAGIRFYGISLPGADIANPPAFPIIIQYILTVLWIFGVTTVINWTDGLDGLAGGFSGITAVTLFFFALMMRETTSAFMSVALIGCIIAFLRFNWFPAKIYMGDAGANLLGYMLAVISLHGAFKQATIISLVIPVLALGVPIFDSIFVVIKRFIQRKPIYKPDHSHLHQRLAKKGLNPVQTVLFLYLLCVCVNLTSIIIMLL